MVRVRFAPSPTGHIHLGNARTALFNWLFARHEKGVFILRVEDTDVSRSEATFTQSILEDLRWLGLDWDEGPDVGGDYGPYRQSERRSIYRDHAERLRRSEMAYPCFCRPQELARRREEAMKKGEPPRYDNRCRNLTDKERQAFRDEGREPSLRFKVREGPIRFRDRVRGEVTFDLGLIGDFVIMKSDQMPTYHFAVCVDDGLMRITHVARGEDHLSNTPRHILLFEALGFNPPEFAHLSMIGKAGGGRLSKRESAPSVRTYREEGILPEAMLNYLALLGWTPKGDEVLTTPQLIAQFSLDGLTKSRAALDSKKMEHISGRHIRKADPAHLAKLVSQRTGTNAPWLEPLVRAVQDHLVTLADIDPYLEILKRDVMAFESAEPAVQELIRNEKGQKVLEHFKEIVDGMKEIDGEGFARVKGDLASKTGLRGGEILRPVRAALTRARSGPELHLVLALLGRERILRRVDEALKFGRN